MYNHRLLRREWLRNRPINRLQRSYAMVGYRQTVGRVLVAAGPCVTLSDGNSRSPAGYGLVSRASDRNARHSTDAGSVLGAAKGCFSLVQLSVQTLSRSTCASTSVNFNIKSQTLVATPLLGHTIILHTSEDIKLHLIIILVFLAIPK